MITEYDMDVEDVWNSKRILKEEEEENIKKDEEKVTPEE